MQLASKRSDIEHLCTELLDLSDSTSIVSFLSSDQTDGNVPESRIEGAFQEKGAPPRGQQPRGAVAPSHIEHCRLVSWGRPGLVTWCCGARSQTPCSMRQAEGPVPLSSHLQVGLKTFTVPASENSPL
ncbi:hypothetical protein MC885_005594 [Smutsia gigantea]|nr:hypothetical protein MC885_005594 [Smutsia gigantea]